MLLRARRRNQYRLLGALAASVIAVTAWGGSSSTAGSSASSAVPSTDLTGVCPKTITLQTDWFPEAEYGAYFSLIGAKGTLDAKKGTYTGPLGKTGVNL